MAWTIEAYLAVDKNGAEGIFSNPPHRNQFGVWEDEICNNRISLPTGTIEKIIDRPLSWNDEPVEIKGPEY